jgi:CBS domain containing-hemolysin-like protein
MAVVVDEFGSAIGIVTLEDIIGKVVGDVNVGFDVPDNGRADFSYTYEKVGPASYLFDARYPLSEVNEILGIALPINEFHTLGGQVSGRLRHVAHVDEAIVEGGYRFTVTAGTSRAPTQVKVDAAG